MSKEIAQKCKNKKMLQESQQQQEQKASVPKTYAYNLLSNIHEQLKPPTAAGRTYCIRGDYTYFHYGCDGHNDSGWGCAYRSLQSTCSWILNKREQSEMESVPSIREIQETLVRIGDKPSDFVGSRDWMGSLEVFFVVDTLYDVSCKILHIPRCEDIKKYVNILQKYFQEFGGFAMMGGDADAASKGIVGIHISGNEAYLLVVDPHFVSVPKNASELVERGYIRWQHISEFVDSSFYNICLPQLK